jgi:hypothetical protein
MYRVRVGEDDYLGTAEEVVGFMARAQGAPGRDVHSYMEGVAERLRDRLGIDVPTHDPTAFLDALAARSVLRVERLREPSRDEPVDPQRVLDQGAVTLGEGVSPDDLPL